VASYQTVVEITMANPNGTQIEAEWSERPRLERPQAPRRGTRCAATRVSTLRFGGVQDEKSLKQRPSRERPRRRPKSGSADAGPTDRMIATCWSWGPGPGAAWPYRTPGP